MHAGHFILILNLEKGLVHSWKKTTNSMALVCKQTIPIEQPPLVGEVSANFSG
jgi:hypothetical protein